MSQNGWTKEKVQAEIEKQKQFTAESIQRALLSYEPSWLEECYKAVDIKSFAAQFWGRYNFTRESSTMRNEYDFGGAQRNPYTTQKIEEATHTWATSSSLRIPQHRTATEYLQNNFQSS